jgi:hypothetical protein
MIRSFAPLTLRKGQIYPILTMMALIDEDLVVQEIVFPGQLHALLDFSCDFIRIFLFSFLFAGYRYLSLATIYGWLPRGLFSGLTKLLVKVLNSLFLCLNLGRVMLCLKLLELTYLSLNCH